jgi:hypothetical protein
LARLSALKRTANWMPKSTPSPTNSGMKATEITFSRPTASSPSASVMTSPVTMVPMIAATIRPDRTASHRQPSIATTITAPISPMPSRIEPNSSSASGTSPVCPR